MKKYYLSLFIALVVCVFGVVPIFAGVLDSSVTDTIKGDTNTAAIAGGYSGGVGSLALGTLLATVIKAFLGILGIVFLIITVHAGYMWMMAGGEAAKVDKAKDSIFRAVIGLIIVVSAYALTAFVFRAVGSAAGSRGDAAPVEAPLP